jgi:hypothetical protein
VFARPIVVAVLLFMLASPLAPQTPAGTLVLRNTQADSMRVEVRVGSSTDCAASRTAGTRTLKRNQRWEVVTARVICWRREAEPGNAASGWTAWRTAQVAAATKREVAL